MIILQILLYHLLPCLAIATEASNQKSAENVSAYSLIQIVPKTNENIELLRYLQTNINANGMDFWSFPTIVGKTVLVLVHPELNKPLTSLLSQRNMTKYVIAKNIREIIEDERSQLASEKNGLHRARKPHPLRAKDSTHLTYSLSIPFQISIIISPTFLKTRQGIILYQD